MGSDRKSKEEEKKKKNSRKRSPSFEDERKYKKRHRGEEEEEDEEKERRSRKKDKRKKESKSHKHRSDKENKSKDKHKGKHHKGDHLQNFQELSSDDYFSKNNEFATWLKEEKKVFFSDLSSESAREMFSDFVKDWNNQKLDSRYYEGITSGPRSAHSWSFRK